MKRISLLIAGLALSVLLTLTACSKDSKEAVAENVSSEQAPSPTASSAPSSSEPSLSESAAPKEPGSRGYLWRVTGGANDGYLVGTIHVARPNMYPLDPDLEQAANSADYIGLELDLTKVDQMQFAMKVAEMALLTDGTSLKDYVSEEDYEKFKAAMKKSLGIVGASVFDQYEPWYAAMTLESLPAMKYQQTDGIDTYLAKKAHETGKTVIELESAESQIGIFDGFSEELQKLYFHQTVEAVEQAAAGYEQLLEMWTAGDPAALERMYVEYVEEGKKSMGSLFDEFDQAMLVGRNAEMVRQIDEYLQHGDNGTYLFAVGSLHMVGEHGLVEALERLGYQIEYME